jgi:predicted nuclease of restriction endonuclease-like (RecB) superfamily
VSKKKPAASGLVPAKRAAVVVPARLIADVRKLIDEARDLTARAVNSALVLLYWGIGSRIRRDILKEKRAEYGKQILGTLSQELSKHYGKGYTYDNLTRMVKLAEVYPDHEIVATLSRQLGWSHFVEILPIEDQLKRDFYAEMCRVERWSVRALRDRIGGMLFERTALSRKPEALAEQELARLRIDDRLSPDLVFRDPYFLDFLGLKDTYGEEDLEAAILREIEAFLLELGADSRSWRGRSGW